MSIKGRLERDPEIEIDPADLIEAEIEEEDQGLRLVNPSRSTSNGYLGETEREKSSRKKIRDLAIYYAQTKGGEIEDWIEELTLTGRPFSEREPEARQVCRPVRLLQGRYVG
jgi:hypothetical protein